MNNTVNTNQNQIGKFIVIEGIDGSGKATQTKLLSKRLKKQGYEVEIISFPQYNTKSAGLIEEYLNGKYGDVEEVGPYEASIFYACDRHDASRRIKSWLQQGRIVIANRYVTANMGHQGAKIANSLERKAFYDWLLELEYKLFKIPRPDLTIILDLNIAVAKKLIAQRNTLDWRGQENDIQQSNLNHLAQARSTFHEIAENYRNIILIDCARDETIKSKPEINDLIWQQAHHILEPSPFQSIAPDFKYWHVLSQNDQKTDVIQPTIPDKHLKVQKITDFAQLPTKTGQENRILFLFAAEYISISPWRKSSVRTGLIFALPPNYIGLVYADHDLTCIIDEHKQDELRITIYNHSEDILHISPGQQIARMIIQKIKNLNIVEHI